MIDINKNKKEVLLNIFGDKYQKWSKKYPIMDNQDVQSWLVNKIRKYTLKGKEASSFSLTTYVKPLQDYCNHNKCENPSKLLQENLDVRNERLMSYLQFLLRDKNEATVKNMIQSRIKSFYSDRGKKLTVGMDTVGSGANKREVLLNRSLIKKIKAKLGTEYRLICKFQTQTGLRINDILKELSSGDYIIQKFKDHYYIKDFRTAKLGININFLFFTKELSELVQSVSGEDDLMKVDLKTLIKSSKGNIVDSSNYLRRVKQVAKELGIVGNVKTHAFRKYFSSQVRKGEVGDEFKEHLMGHAPYNLSQAYNNNLKDIDWFYKEWKKLETLICVDCVVYDKTSVEIVKLKKEMAKKDEQINILIKQNLELDKKIEGIEEGMSDFLQMKIKLKELLKKFSSQ